MMLILSGSYLPFASGVAGGDIARLISSKEGPWDHQHECEEGGQDPDEEDIWRWKLYLRALGPWRCVGVPVAVGGVVAIGQGALGNTLQWGRESLESIWNLTEGASWQLDN